MCAIMSQEHTPTLGESCHDSCERLLTCGTRPDTGATFRQSRRTPYAEIAINISGITDNDNQYCLKTLANLVDRYDQKREQKS